MEPDTESLVSESNNDQVHPHNFSDLQNYLVTFKKEIEGSTDTESTFHHGDIQRFSEEQSASVSSFVSDSSGTSRSPISLLSKTRLQHPSGDDDLGPVGLPLVSPNDTKDCKTDDIEGSESDLGEDLGDDDHLSSVHAQIAELTGGAVQAVTIAETLPLEGLSSAVSTVDTMMLVPVGSIEAASSSVQQKLVKIVSVNGQQHLQLIDSPTNSKSREFVDSASLTSINIENEGTTTVSPVVTSGSLIDGADPVAVLASVAANTSTVNQIQALQLSQHDLSNAQLLALQNTSDGSHHQLVAVQSMDGTGIGDGSTLQVVGSLENPGSNSLMINTGNTYQTVTLVPSGEVNQSGEVNYVLIVNQPGGDKDHQSMFDMSGESRGDVIEEIIDADGITRKIVRINPIDKRTLMNMQGVQLGDQLVCNYCDYTSPKRYLLTRHMKTHSEDRPHKCNICDRGFKTMASLQNHVNTHTGTRPHKCKQCDAAFTTSGELVRHIRYRHTFEKPHKCTECDYASVELSKLKRHMRSHTGERPYQCHHCNYASPDTYKLKRHLRIHTGEKPYECEICHARFTQSNSLKAHKLIHTGNKPIFKCDLCPATCGRKTDLKIHIQKLHISEKPLVCRKCEDVFPDRYTFKLHSKIHDGEKCFKCPECDYAALSQRHLEIHTLTHSGEKPFQCDECEQSFRQKQLLKRHKNLYHTTDYVPPTPKDKEHECLECDKSYANKGNLVRHLAQHDSECSSDCKRRTDGDNLIPLSADHIIQNSLLADMREGKLGASPKVVVVHPDGRVEEVTAKLQSLTQSQSKPVEDFWMSLGVGSDSNLDSSGSGPSVTEGSISAGSIGETTSSGDATSLMDSHLHIRLTHVKGHATGEMTLRECGDNKLDTLDGLTKREVHIGLDMEVDDQTKDAGTQAAFDSDSDGDSEKTGESSMRRKKTGQLLRDLSSSRFHVDEKLFKEDRVLKRANLDRIEPSLKKSKADEHIDIMT
ncbi:hypothetical protein ACJMK2_009556 [Sinanodonta woodiana]|uniref:CCCTC-binding factor n=1 Tax=Sinanodonta woodiana TaxID=1069815 RepID=A0ABD3VDT9_SINWO